MKKTETNDYMDIADVKSSDDLAKYLGAMYQLDITAEDYTNMDAIESDMAYIIILYVRLRGLKLLKYLISKRYRYVLKVTLLYDSRSVPDMRDKDEVKIKIAFTV